MNKSHSELLKTVENYNNNEKITVTMCLIRNTNGQNVHHEYHFFIS